MDSSNSVTSVQSVILPRLVIHRGFGTPLAAGTKQCVELVLSDEFNEPFPISILKSSRILASFYSSLDRNIEHQGCDLNLTIRCYRGNVGIYEFEVPSHPGDYYIRLCVEMLRNDETLAEDFGNPMLSLFTEKFKVVDAVGLGPSDRQALLGCYRRNLDPTIIVREEYGATLGSHVYDSTIVMMHFLKETFASMPSMEFQGAVLELGSGCGLLGLWFASYFKMVYLTDKSSQMKILRENTELNGPEMAEKVFCAELEWGDRLGFGGGGEFETPTSASALRERISSHQLQLPLKLIVAADVFYDREAANALFQVLDDFTRAVTTLPPPRIILAQKLRSDTLTNCNLHRPFPYAEEKFTWKILRIEWNVRIIEFFRK